MWFRKAPRQAFDERFLELVSQIHGVLQRVKALEEDLAALSAAHERLRGRFYSTRGPSSPPETPRTESKAEILARMGYIRGGAPPKES